MIMENTKFSLITNETQLVKSILNAVNYYGFFWRNNTGANKINNGNGTRFVRFGLPGSSDIIGVYKGCFVAIEVKSERGRISESQRKFSKHIADNGGIYILAYSVDDALKGLLNDKRKN